MDRRADDALALAARLDRQRAAEAAQASALIAAFVEQARQAGVAPQRLQASAYGSGARLRTNVTGWYLRRDRAVGIGEDGSFYILSVPAGIKDRITGVTLQPSDPPMELGRGGKDGESIPLATALERALRREV